MKAVGFYQSLAIEEALSLQDIEIPEPVALGRDLLVKIKAIATNPVDYKVRLNMPPADGDYKVLGWDAVGEVVACGDEVTQFAVGDAVYYAGDITRQGSNAEYQLVDERIVGNKPKSLSYAEAAALPLTAITAWELLFDHLNITQQNHESVNKTDEVILVVGAAGGVGSIFIQIAKAITGATIIATASRPETQAWVKNLGADYVIDHNKPLKAQIDALDIGSVTHVASLNGTSAYYDDYIELLAPFGKIALIDDLKNADITKIKQKSLSLHWEFMFTRSMFNAKDMEVQSQLLNRIADLVDAGYIQTTLGQHLGVINAKNLRLAHKHLESATSIGKLVLEGF